MAIQLHIQGFPPPTPSSGTTFRYFNLGASSSSLESASPSSVSEYTTTSSSTNPGLGSITGKGILAFGKMALRGLDGIIIRRRFTAINLIFPHKDDDPIANLDTIYDDVLELSRRGLYGQKVRKKAFKMILGQVASGNTHHLIQSIIKWPPYEILLLLTELLSCMPLPWLQLTGLPEIRTEMHEDLCSAYHTYLHSAGGNSHGATPLINFMCHLVQANSSGCQAVLEAGFLDVLLALCLQDFPMASSWLVADPWLYTKASLLATWDTMLHALATNPQASSIFSQHPLHAVWPKLQTGLHHLRGRQQGWKVLILDANVVELRWAGIWKAIRSLSQDADPTTSTLDLCVYMLEFVSSHSLPSDVSDRLLRDIIIWVNDNPWQMQRMIQALLHAPCEGCVEILSRFFESILAKTHSSQTHFVHGMRSLIACIMCASESSQANKDKLVSAGILSHILLLLSQELEDPAIVSNCASLKPLELWNEIITIGTTRLFAEDQLVSKERDLFLKAFCAFFGRPDSPTHGHSISENDVDEDPFTWISSLALGTISDSTKQAPTPAAPRARTQNSLSTFSSSRTVTPSSIFTTTTSSTITGSRTSSGLGARPRDALLRIKRFTLRGLRATVSKNI